MNKKLTHLTAALAMLGLPVWAQDGRQAELTYWFDTPLTMRGQAVWYKGHPERWVGRKPVSAGDDSTNPDQDWESKSLPIGNGSIGANIMGSIEAERLTLNEKTLWRGGPNTKAGAAAYWNVNKQSAHVMQEIRDAFRVGDWAKAEFLTKKNFNSNVPYESYAEDNFRFGNFTTAGELYVETGLSTVGMSGYRRALSVDSALARVEFVKDGVKYTREYFASYPANVIAVRFAADRGAMQNLTLSYAPNPVSEGSMSVVGEGELLWNARLDNNDMQYAVRIKAMAKGGSTTARDGKITVKGADEVVILLTADTDYSMNLNPDFADSKTYVGVDPVATTAGWMSCAAAKGWDSLRREHYDDYAALFGRVKFSVNNAESEGGDRPIDVRLADYRKGKKDYWLEGLYYQFGRYLLISSSRPGNMPANLQGIWHNNVDGPWRVDYHNNINLQMNYWPALSTNLVECALPLMDFIGGLVKPGEVTARSYYGARGWTTSISGNIFGFTTPLSSEDMSWNFSPFAGPWLATHVWDYYDYTRDKEWLRSTGYDLIKGSARFAYDYLWKREDGTWTAAPSTSPEHGPVDEGATFAHAVIREILLDAIEASKTLGVDAKERKEWENALRRIAPYSIGRYGQLMEWSMDIDDPKDEHRHVNHLFGLHPGRTISPVNTPDLAKASRIVLEHRGDGATGWSMGWKLNQWARLHDGNHAYTLYGNLLKNGTLDNLWDTHAPFQIDGNFGGTAGVTEMIMQSHAGFIHLLPALPDAWRDGSVTGLRAKGDFTLDIYWRDGKLERVVVSAGAGGKCELRYGNAVKSFKMKKGETREVTFA